MIPVACFKDKKIALFGLGDSGIATALALLAGGAEVIGFDDKDKSCFKAEKSGILVKDLHRINWSEIAAFILAPGVPLHYPKPHWSVELARQYGVEIIGDIELFMRARADFLQKNELSSCDCPFIAITGTNGKSTTTNLTAYLLKEAGFDVEMGGNIGVPILALEAFKKGRFYVIECSSFQIDLAPSLQPTIGALLNLTPDHIERHNDFPTYCAVKERVITKAEYALIGVEEEACQKIGAKRLASKKPCAFIAKDRLLKRGYWGQGRKLFYQDQDEIEQLADLSAIAELQGPHNVQNTLTALAITRFFAKDFAAQQALSQYKNLPHRMARIGKKGPILFINDSKATNAEAARAALEACHNIYWILGGIAKEGGIESLRDLFPKIKKAYLIGQASTEFAKTIGDAFPYFLCQTLENATKQASKDAVCDLKDNKKLIEKKPIEAVILFSPACASYDQFPHYVARGDAFVGYAQEILQNLPEV